MDDFYRGFFLKMMLKHMMNTAKPTNTMAAINISISYIVFGSTHLLRSSSGQELTVISGAS